MADHELLREKDVALRYGFTLSWLRRTRRERRGPTFIRLGRIIFYRVTDIEDFLTIHEVETKASRTSAEESRLR